MLTEQKLKQLQGMEKPYKVYDADGLLAIVQPSGALWWRYRYRLMGRDSSMAIGVYPVVSLLEARKRRDDAKRLVVQGIDPAQHRRDEKGAAKRDLANTFLAVSEEWLEMMQKRLSPASVSKYRYLLNTFLYPRIGDKPISEITTPVLFDCLKSIEQGTVGSAAPECRVRCAQVFRYARTKGIQCINVTEDMRGALLPTQTENHPAITDPRQLAPLLTAIRSYDGEPITRIALQLAPIVFVRPNELRNLEWSDLDFDGASWTVPVSKLKGRKNANRQQSHVIPLSTQALELLTQAKQISGCLQYVFPNRRGCVYPMSKASLTYALRRIGYAEQQSWHGFRATARTILEEVLSYRAEWIEMQLAHTVKDPNGKAYNRTAFLGQRREMMQRWADYLDSLCKKPGVE